MLYGTAAAALLAVAAAAADAALRAVGRPTRWAWAAALLLSLALPPLAWWRTVAAAPAADAAAPTPAADGGAGVGIGLEALMARATVRVAPAPAWAALDRPLVALWALLAAAGLGRLAVARRRLRRARAEWRAVVVDATPVLVAGRTGPAVAGVLRPAVVLPEWALGADPALRRLMLAHEREHVRAGDPPLLAAAAVVAALLPWNPALWYQLRRLRLAVEVDCDRRVLRRHPDVARYGALLLEVGRRAPGPTLPLAALTSPTSLERRIRTMTTPRPRHALARGLALLGTSALAAAAALVVPQPAIGTLQAQTAAASATVPIERVREAVRTAMPALLEEETGTPATLTFVVNVDGDVVHASYQRQRTLAPSMAHADAAAGGEHRVLIRKQAGPEAMLDVQPEAIASVEVLKLAPGALLPDSANVVWIQLSADAAPDAHVGVAHAAAAIHGAGVQRVRVAAPASGAGAGGGELELVPSTTRATAGARGGTSVEVAPSRAATGGRVVIQGLGTAGAPLPLFVLDGEIVGPDIVHALLPERIASIEVLKGSAALQAYGDAGVNGVVTIRTKP